ncbi:MAG: helicase-associated domain-containing protein, partial [Agrococcus casei]
MARGRTAEELLERLHRLSQTGVPQPVEYLLRDAERRFGAVQVTEGETATVRTDGDTAKRLLVDRALTAIELRVPTGRAIEEGVLHSASSSDVVLDKLVEERYPALLVDAEGAPVVSERRIATVSGRAPLSNLTERLRGLGVEVSSMQPDWLQAQLIAAVKSKMPVRVTVASGTQVQHATLVPLSVSNGRLRGRDLERDLERTLPLRAIVEVAGLQNA